MSIRIELTDMKTLTRPAAVLVAALLLFGCASEMPAPTPPEVTIAKPQLRDVTAFAEFPGTTRSFFSLLVPCVAPR